MNTSFQQPTLLHQAMHTVNIELRQSWEAYSTFVKSPLIPALPGLRQRLLRCCCGCCGWEGALLSVPSQALLHQGSQHT